MLLFVLATLTAILIEQALSYARIVVWMALGFAIYFFYGISHSNLGLNTPIAPTFKYRAMANDDDSEDMGAGGHGDGDGEAQPPSRFRDQREHCGREASRPSADVLEADEVFGHRVVAERGEVSYGLLARPALPQHHHSNMAGTSDA